MMVIVRRVTGDFRPAKAFCDSPRWRIRCRLKSESAHFRVSGWAYVRCADTRESIRQVSYGLTRTHTSLVCYACSTRLSSRSVVFRMAFLFDGSTRPPTIITSATTMFTSIALIVSSIVVIGLLLPDTSQASLIPFEIDTDSTSVNAPPTPNQVRNDYDDSQGSSRSEPNHLDELSANLTRTTRNCHRRAYNFKAVNRYR